MGPATLNISMNDYTDYSNREAINLNAFLQALPMHVMHHDAFKDIDFDTKLQVARALGALIDKELPRVKGRK